MGQRGSVMLTAYQVTNSPETTLTAMVKSSKATPSSTPEPSDPNWILNMTSCRPFKDDGSK